MRTRLMTVSMTAFALAGTLGLAAQAPQPQTPSPQTPAQPSASQPASDIDRQQPPTRANTAAAGQTVTVAGCVKAEKDVPGRTVNPAEKAGISEDYILTDVKMGAGSSTSGIGLAPMYEIKGLDNSELKKHLNHQVEITGTLETKAAGTMAAGAAANKDLPDLHGTSVKMLAATCSAQ